jgi:peptidoglycan/xylan/chitin deacetylase (PgdA/CDA1 family)
MRVDRFLTLYFFHPLRKTLLRPNGIRIPILMYHSISDEPESGIPYYRVNTSPKRFAEQLRFLKENDYEVISLEAAAEILDTATIPTDSPSDRGVSIGAPSYPRSSRVPMSRGTRGVPHRYVVVTFDDGFADFRTTAFPLLREFGFCATVFLPTGFISEDTSIWKGKKCMRWSDVCELAGSGVRFGSHTVTHPRLIDLPWDQVEKELRESRNILQDRLGTGVESFSYPYAFPEADPGFRARLRTSLAALGYANGVTTKVGTATGGDDRLFHRRIPVNSGDDPAFFRLKLEGGYDWMHVFQYGYKHLKRPSVWNRNGRRRFPAL